MSVSSNSRLERTITISKTKKTRQETIYGMTSLSAEQASSSQLLRSYWRIENSLHYPRDVTLHEDQTRFKNHAAAHHMAIINNLVLALIAKSNFPFVPSARRFCAARPHQALAKRETQRIFFARNFHIVFGSQACTKPTKSRVACLILFNSA
jgi:hypothetical protein